MHYKWHEPKSNLAQHETVLSLLKSPLFSLFPFLTQWTKGKKNFFDWSHMKKETGNRGPTCGTEFEAHAIIFYLFLALCRCWGSSTWDSYILVGTILLILEPPFQFGCGFFTSLTFSPYLFYLARSCKRKRFRNPMPPPYIPIVWFFLLYPFWR